MLMDVNFFHQTLQFNVHQRFDFHQSWSLGQNLRDRDETLTLRDRDFERKLKTRPRLERAEAETRHETFETKRLQYFANIFDTKFWTFGELPNTLQYRFLGISLLYKEQAN